MSKGISVIYERGVLRPLQPLEIPENSRLEIEIIGRSAEPNGDLSAARRVLQQEGVIGPMGEATGEKVSDEALDRASEALGAAGPLSDEIIDDREGR